MPLEFDNSKQNVHLHNAIGKNDIQAVQRALAEGADPAANLDLSKLGSSGHENLFNNALDTGNRHIIETILNWSKAPRKRIDFNSNYPLDEHRHALKWLDKAFIVCPNVACLRVIYAYQNEQFPQKPFAEILNTPFYWPILGVGNRMVTLGSLLIRNNKFNTERNGTIYLTGAVDKMRFLLDHGFDVLHQKDNVTKPQPLIALARKLHAAMQANTPEAFDAVKHEICGKWVKPIGPTLINADGRVSFRAKVIVRIKEGDEFTDVVVEREVIPDFTEITTLVIEAAELQAEMSAERKRGTSSSGSSSGLSDLRREVAAHAQRIDNTETKLSEHDSRLENLEALYAKLEAEMEAQTGMTSNVLRSEYPEYVAHFAQFHDDVKALLKAKRVERLGLSQTPPTDVERMGTRVIAILGFTLQACPATSPFAGAVMAGGELFLKIQTGIDKNRSSSAVRDATLYVKPKTFASMIATTLMHAVYGKLGPKPNHRVLNNLLVELYRRIEGQVQRLHQINGGHQLSFIGPEHVVTFLCETAASHLAAQRLPMQTPALALHRAAASQTAYVENIASSNAKPAEKTRKAWFFGRKHG